MTTIQNVILSPVNSGTDKRLFYRATDTDVFYSEKTKSLSVKNKISFDTYFNAFSLGKYRKYCGQLSLFLNLRVSGFFVVRIFGFSKNKEELITEKKITALYADSFDILVDDNGRYDHIYFELDGEGMIYGAEYSYDNEIKNRVSIAVVITTYKREKFLLRNHREICNYLAQSKELDTDSIHFYIVDNGRTLKKEEIENDYVTLLPNPNTGGSGGFSRGYYEAVHSGKGFTHILFADDDIVMDCEAILRVYRLLQYRSEEYPTLAVGGSMIKLSDGKTLHEAGAYWDGKHLFSIGNGTDLTERKNVLSSDEKKKPDYNAWWFYCFPSSWQKDYGYPLQFFIKEDDIEYSLRCADEIAIIGGIAVWHDDFEGKYDGFQEYYIKRNELILTSVNDQKPYAVFQVRKLILNIMKQIVYQRYFLADLVFRAYDDYLLGWEHFKNTDTEKLNTELMSSCKQFLDDDELKKKYVVAFDKAKYEQSMTEPDKNAALLLTLNGYLLPAKKEDFYVVDIAKCRYVNFFRHKKVLHYDTAKHRGFVTVQKRSSMFRYFFLMLGKSIKFLIKYPSVRRGYKQHLRELADYKPL